MLHCFGQSRTDRQPELVTTADKEAALVIRSNMLNISACLKRDSCLYTLRVLTKEEDRENGSIQ